MKKSEKITWRYTRSLNERIKIYAKWRDLSWNEAVEVLIAKALDKQDS